MPTILCFSGRECLVWILGHSYIFWGAKRAAVRPEGRQLGFPRSTASVRWIGVPDMLWSWVLLEVHWYARLDWPPGILLLRVGGNDPGLRAARELILDTTLDFLHLRSFFPDTILVWSDIVAKSAWRMARSMDKLSKAQIKVNKEVATFFVMNGGLAVRHLKLEGDNWIYSRGDGVYLNAIGIDMRFLSLQEGIQRAFPLWRAAKREVSHLGIDGRGFRRGHEGGHGQNCLWRMMGGAHLWYGYLPEQVTSVRRYQYWGCIRW